MHDKQTVVAILTLTCKISSLATNCTSFSFRQHVTAIHHRANFVLHTV